MKRIALSANKKCNNSGKYSAQVDDEDYERVNNFYWHADIQGRTVYATRNVKINGKRRIEKMHRFILGITDPSIHVDHIDHNGLNN